MLADESFFARNDTNDGLILATDACQVGNISGKDCVKLISDSLNQKLVNLIIKDEILDVFNCR